MTTYRTGYVYINNILAGYLKETDTGYSFKYDSNYLINYDIPVSLTLPLTTGEYQSNFLFPFFDGLIPEGWLLNTIVHNWKLDYNDRFGILLYSGNDVIGNVRIKDCLC